MDLTGLKSPHVVIDKRRCARCRLYKPLDQFRYREDKKFYDSYCHPCMAEYQREYYRKNKEKISARESGRSRQRWQDIKKDPILHARILEDKRLHCRLKAEREGRVMLPRTPLFSQPTHHIKLDKQPLMKFVREKIKQGYTKADVARQVGFDDGNMTRLFYANTTVSFYMADRICTAFSKSVYDLYPEMIHD